MFENLQQQLANLSKNLRGHGRLSEDNIKESLRQVRLALLDADVALPVIKALLERVKTRAIGQEVLQSIQPGQAFIKIVHDELVNIMGEREGLNFRQQPPAVILLAGLQGAGKTTTVGKLAKFIQEHERKKVGVVSVDVYRPAAIQQLQTVAKQAGAEFIDSQASEKPEAIVRRALDIAKKSHLEVLLVDSAGRLHVDAEMMAEIQAIHKILQPVETLFVVDSMTGQDAAKTAQAFNEALPLTGVILTKTDGDARGGAALSIREITGKPIKFLGTGEKLTGLEAFDPKRIAGRILGMGDIVGLVEQAQREVDSAQAEKIAQKIQKGKGLTLQDFMEQLQQMQKLGGLQQMLDKMPVNGGKMPTPAQIAQQEKETRRMIAIIQSMTPQERRQPEILKASRKRRIAQGSGTQVQDINRLLKQFTQMQTMMKQFGKSGQMQKILAQMQGKGGLPPF
jgi:signal recognition particle subunit SRP54